MDKKYMYDNERFIINGEPKIIGVVFEPNDSFDVNNLDIKDSFGKFYIDYNDIDDNVDSGDNDFLVFLNYIVTDTEDAKTPFSCRICMAAEVTVKDINNKDEILKVLVPELIYEKMKVFYSDITSNSIFGELSLPELK